MTEEYFFSSAITGTTADWTAKMKTSIVAHLQNLHRQAEWLNYEVDPEWSRFCSFGPDDIGGPFEKLGVIRRKPRIDVLHVSQDVLDRMREYVQKERAAAGDPAGNNSNTPDPRSLYGIPIVMDNRLPPGSAIGVASSQAMEMGFMKAKIPMAMMQYGIASEDRWKVGVRFP